MTATGSFPLHVFCVSPRLNSYQPVPLGDCVKGTKLPSDLQGFSTLTLRTELVSGKIVLRRLHSHLDLIGLCG